MLESIGNALFSFLVRSGKLEAHKEVRNWLSSRKAL